MKGSSKNILIYYSNHLKSFDLTSLIFELQKYSANVYLLTTGDKGKLHKQLEEKNIQTFSIDFKKNKTYYIKQSKYLIRFIKKNKIDIVYSHTQINNFIASLSQLFSKSEFYMCRHHTDYVWNGKNKSAKLMDWLINRLSKNMVAISDKVYNQVVKVEGVSSEKVHQINLGYDFSLYPKVNQITSQKIKQTYKSDFLLLNIGRLIPLKRQRLLIEACSLLAKKDINFKLIILGEGSEKENLTLLIEELDLKEKVHLIGFKENALDFIDAADLIVHPSNSEASSTIGKECALIKTPIMACKTVGDFDSYLNEQNGYLIDLELTAAKLSTHIEKAFLDKKSLKSKGEMLHNEVINKFGIENVIPAYKELFNL